jgi:hypothetical protein
MERFHPILTHILCPSQPVFAFSAACLVGKTAHTNVIAVGLTQLGLKSMIYLIECEHTNLLRFSTELKG